MSIHRARFWAHNLLSPLFLLSWLIGDHHSRCCWFGPWMSGSITVRCIGKLWCRLRERRVLQSHPPFSRLHCTSQSTHFSSKLRFKFLLERIRDVCCGSTMVVRSVGSYHYGGALGEDWLLDLSRQKAIGKRVRERRVQE